MDRPKIVVLTRVPDVVWRACASAPRSSTSPSVPRAEWGAALADAVGVLSSSNAPLDAAFFAEAPALKIVAMQSVGYDNVDLAVLRERGIVLTNSRGSLVEAVADLDVRARHHGGASTRRRRWRGRAGRWMEGDAPYSHDLAGATLGIVGFGAIGRPSRAARRSAGCASIYTTRTPARRRRANRCIVPQVRALLAESDCVVALLPLSPQTRGMFGDAAFARMKPTATFVNAARGPICDTAALLRALEQKKIAGAALDVTDPEPLPPDHPLYARDDVVITPHIGSATSETRTRMAMLAAENLLAFIDGKPLPDASRALARPTVSRYRRADGACGHDAQPAAERAARDVDGVREQPFVRVAHFLHDFDHRGEAGDDQRRAQRRLACGRQRFVDDEAEQRERDHAVDLAQCDRCGSGVVLAEHARQQVHRQGAAVDAMARRRVQQHRDHDDRERDAGRLFQDGARMNSVSDWRLPPLTGPPAGR